jgi:hypothetical protein
VALPADPRAIQLGNDRRLIVRWRCVTASLGADGSYNQGSRTLQTASFNVAPTVKITAVR